MLQPFSPSPWARNAHLQTIFGSIGFLAAGKNEMADCAHPTIVEAGSHGRLLGFHSRQTDRAPRGLAILLHGWEGSAGSAYILSTGRFLYRQGYDIFRLNLWDHGKSHHLNQGLFHGAMTTETAEAVASVARLLPEGPVVLIGFSLGGNFALRTALCQSEIPIPNLKQVFCISPALDPYECTLAIDQGPSVYRHYFLTKWKRSLREKERCFPDLYRFETILHHRTCMALTEAIMPWYPQFGDYRDYFRRYTLTGDGLAPLAIPTTIFAAVDDPIVSAETFGNLPQNRCLKVFMQRYGGHCGFRAPFPFGCWYERSIAEILAAG